MSNLIFTTSSSPEFTGARWQAGCQGSPGKTVTRWTVAGPLWKWPNKLCLASAAPRHLLCLLSPWQPHIVFLRIIFPFNCRLLLRASRNPHFSDPFNSFMTSGFYETHLLISFPSTRRFSDSFLSSFPLDALQGIARHKVVSTPSHRSTSMPTKRNKNVL